MQPLHTAALLLVPHRLTPVPCPAPAPHPPHTRPTPAVPKPSDPRAAVFPTQLDNPFVKQLCKCLRTGTSTSVLHDINK